MLVAEMGAGWKNLPRIYQESLHDARSTKCKNVKECTGNG
jgi:hypothetical protein